MKVLVTGANGFVGRVVVETLLAQGLSVAGAVRSSAAAHNLPAGSAPVCIGDIDGSTDWSAALDKVEVVVHLAARVHVMQESDPDPLGSFRRVNVAGTERLARMAAERGVRRLIFLSTVKVNGEFSSPDRPFTEADVPAPQDDYGLSKWEAEQALNRIAADTGIQVIVLRPPLVYGPDVKGNFLRLLNLVRLGVPLPLGSVDNRRSMLYVENLADLLCHCAVSSHASPGTFLVADGEDLSTVELLKQTARLMGRPSRVFVFPPRWLAVLSRLAGKTQEYKRLAGSLCIDSRLVRSSFGWHPPFTAKEGLARTLAWYKEQL